MKTYTVIFIHTDNFQINADHVLAKNGLAAFYEVATQWPDDDIELVAAIEGEFSEGENIHYPGLQLVGSATVLEQPEVFV